MSAKIPEEVEQALDQLKKSGEHGSKGRFCRLMAKHNFSITSIATFLTDHGLPTSYQSVRGAVKGQSSKPTERKQPAARPQPDVLGEMRVEEVVGAMEAVKFIPSSSVGAELEWEGYRAVREKKYWQLYNPSGHPFSRIKGLEAAEVLEWIQNYHAQHEQVVAGQPQEVGRHRGERITPNTMDRIAERAADREIAANIEARREEGFEVGILPSERTNFKGETVAQSVAKLMKRGGTSKTLKEEMGLNATE